MISKYSVEFMNWLYIFTKRMFSFYLSNIILIVYLIVFKISAKNIWLFALPIYVYWVAVEAYFRYIQVNFEVNYFKILKNNFREYIQASGVLLVISLIVLFGYSVVNRSLLSGYYSVLYVITTIFITNSCFIYIYKITNNQKVDSKKLLIGDAILQSYSSLKSTLVNTIIILCVLLIFHYFAPVLLVVVTPLALELMVVVLKKWGN